LTLMHWWQLYKERKKDREREREIRQADLVGDVLLVIVVGRIRREAKVIQLYFHAKWLVLGEVLQ